MKKKRKKRKKWLKNERVALTESSLKWQPFFSPAAFWPFLFHVSFGDGYTQGGEVLHVLLLSYAHTISGTIFVKVLVTIRANKSIVSPQHFQRMLFEDWQECEMDIFKWFSLACNAAQTMTFHRNDEFNSNAAAIGFKCHNAQRLAVIKTINTSDI